MDENNNLNVENMNMGANNPVIVVKKKSNALIYIIILLLIIIIAALIVVRARNDGVEPQNQADTELDQTLETDSTVSINGSLDSIVIDESNDEDLKEVDQELQSL